MEPFVASQSTDGTSNTRKCNCTGECTAGHSPVQSVSYQNRLFNQPGVGSDKKTQEVPTANKLQNQS